MKAYGGKSKEACQKSDAIAALNSSVSFHLLLTRYVVTRSTSDCVVLRSLTRISPHSRIVRYPSFFACVRMTWEGSDVRIIDWMAGDILMSSGRDIRPLYVLLSVTSHVAPGLRHASLSVRTRR